MFNLIFIFNKGHILNLYRKKLQNMAVSGGVYDNICGGGGTSQWGGSHFGGGGGELTLVETMISLRNIAIFQK